MGPHEAAVGVLAMLHAPNVSELATLQIDDIDLATKNIRVAGRRTPCPSTRRSFPPSRLVSSTGTGSGPATCT